MLLGMPFLAAYNPIINWTAGKFQGRITAYTCNFPSEKKKQTNQLLHPTNDIHVQKTTISTQLAINATKPKEHPWQEMVPKEYHQFGVVFSNKAAQWFPAKQPWDHAIDLITDAPPTLNCKVYPLSQGQQPALDEFLKEHLKKGYIHRSKSPYASPFFFVKKEVQRPQKTYSELPPA